jgi:hypothetical protein
MGREHPSVAPTASASSLELRDVRFLADAAADGQNELGRRHVDVVVELNSMNSRAVERLAVGGRGELTDSRRCRLFRRLVYVGADGEQHGAAAGEIDFDVHLLSVAAARGHELALDALGLENVGREAQSKFRASAAA